MKLPGVPSRDRTSLAVLKRLKIPIYCKVPTSLPPFGKSRPNADWEPGKSFKLSFALQMRADEVPSPPIQTTTKMAAAGVQPRYQDKMKQLDGMFSLKEEQT